jgi:uncharacterized iron-regulated protein
MRARETRIAARRAVSRLLENVRESAAALMSTRRPRPLPVANLVLAVALVGACACASNRPVAGPRVPLASEGWQSALHRDHSLAGGIWDVRAGCWTNSETLKETVANAHFVLLGETHDNLDHHLAQAEIIRAVALTGRKPALALEALSLDQQHVLDGALVGTAPRPEAIAEAVHWNDGGRAEFALYRPLFQAGIEAGLPLIAADLPRDRQENFIRTGTTWFPLRVRRLLAAEDLPYDAQDGFRAELHRSHCGKMPAKVLDRIVLLQRARDAAMADRLLTIDRELAAPGFEQGGILVAGTEHVRKDRAIAAHLAREAPQRTVVTVAFLEVSADLTTPDAYAGRFGRGPLPFDFVVFTPAAARADPCAEQPADPKKPDAPKRPSHTPTLAWLLQARVD